MADTDPNKPGVQTSEFKLATVLSVAGVLLTGLATVFSALKEQFPNVTWIGSIAGALVAIAPAVAYIMSRGTVKAAQAHADAAESIASAQAALAIATPPAVATATATVKPNP
jgi:hypothetical protein